MPILEQIYYHCVTDMPIAYLRPTISEEIFMGDIAAAISQLSVMHLKNGSKAAKGVAEIFHRHLWDSIHIESDKKA